MKASVRTKYGTPEVLTVKDVAKPIPKANEVLVKVSATTVNRSDYHVLTGVPFFMRFFTGLFRPKLSVTGSDFVGQIEVTGDNVKQFSIGDKVMGFIDMGAGSHAQYLTVPEVNLVRAPLNIPDDQIPACLEGAFYAVSAIQRIRPKAGQHALVIGATGAIGSSYVQFFKNCDVKVTAVCAKNHHELVKSLGAQKVIDFMTEDFRNETDRYDIIADAVGKSSFRQCKHLLKEKGIFTSSQPNLLQVIITSLVGGKKEIFPMPKKVTTSLEFIKDLVEKGKFTPVVDRKYSLNEIREAYAYVGTGQKIGNVIITMDK